MIPLDGYIVFWLLISVAIVSVISRTFGCLIIVAAIFASLLVGLWTFFWYVLAIGSAFMLFLFIAVMSGRST